MKLALACRSTLIALALAIPATVSAHDAPAAPTDVKAQTLMWIKDAESKLVELAAAMPENKYSWRPAKGVRSVGEVFMHVATANFGIPSLHGVQPPEGFKLETYEQSLTRKADIEKALKDSFAHMEAALMKLSDADMENPAEIPMAGMKTNVRGLYMLLMAHAHEHLGQSIAYARSNNVAPPWTARQQAAMKEKMEKEKK